MGRTMLFVEESLHEICYSKKCVHIVKMTLKKKIKISMNFNLLESIMTSTHYWFRENTGFPLKRKSFYFFFCFVNLRQYLTNEIFLWHKSRSKHICTFSFWKKTNQFDFFRSESRPRFDQLVGLPLIFWPKKSIRLPAQKMVRVTYHLEKWTWSVQFVYGKNSKTSGRCKWYAFRTIVRDPSLLLNRVTLLNRNFTLYQSVFVGWFRNKKNYTLTLEALFETNLTPWPYRDT